MKKEINYCKQQIEKLRKKIYSRENSDGDYEKLIKFKNMLRLLHQGLNIDIKEISEKEI